ncbi:MAG: hypothetical protein AB7S44_00585 [Spirochaetales bacterium]
MAKRVKNAKLEDQRQPSNAKKDKLTDVLYKKALGYKLEEVIEEYSKDKDDGELILTKRKVSYKNIPPDISAVKALLELDFKNGASSFRDMSDEELEEEKIKLLNLLNDLQKGETDGTGESEGEE